MKIGRAEIGTILTACSILPLFVPYGSWLVFSTIGLEISHSFLSITNIVGLTLFLSDRKGFLYRAKGNKIVSTPLIIIGLITFVWSLLMISMSLATWRHDYPMVSLAWAGLALISGVLWFLYGLMIWRYESNFQPLKQENKHAGATKEEDRTLKQEHTSITDRISSIIYTRKM